MSAPIFLYIFGTAAVIVLGIFKWATGTLPAYSPPEGAQRPPHAARTAGAGHGTAADPPRDGHKRLVRAALESSAAALTAFISVAPDTDVCPRKDSITTTG
jgi:hypothetical protein